MGNYGYLDAKNGLFPALKKAKGVTNIQLYMGMPNAWEFAVSQNKADPDYNFLSDFLKEFLPKSTQTFTRRQLNFGDNSGSLVPSSKNDAKKVKICGNSDIYIDILAPDIGESKNARSMVLKLVNNVNPRRQKSMLFAGDLEEEDVWEQLTDANIDLKADVLMIPHHGSGTNGNPFLEFYKQVNAHYGIISSHILGKGNTRHPRTETIAAFCNVRNPKNPNGNFQNQYLCLVNKKICPKGISSWTKINNVDEETQILMTQCAVNKKTVFQTTRWDNPKKGNPGSVEARIIFTSLDSKSIKVKDPNAIPVGSDGFGLDGKSTVNMFQLG